MTGELDGAGLAKELKAAIEDRMKSASKEVREKILPRLEEVSTLLASLLVLRLQRAPGEAVSELETVALMRWKMLSVAVELHTIDALQDSLERTVTRLVRAGFGVLLKV